VAALLLVAVSLGLSNLAASVGLGAGGTDRRTRLRVAVVFGLFEGGMPVLGLLLGRGLAAPLGQAAHWAGAALLIAAGGWTLLQAARGRPRPAGAGPVTPPAPSAPPAPAARPAHRAAPGTARLALTGLALSADNLAAGFALGAFRVSLAVAAVTIAAVSAAMSLAGLEAGARIGARAGSRAEILGGVILAGAGIALATGVIS
jgi:manganese efflux pump family protein